MRIEHLVFSLGVVAVSVSSPSPSASETGASALDDLEERSNRFVETRLIPALKKLGVKRFAYKKLHLCHCSLEVGCNARTTGWVPTITELTIEERKLYENTCFTDGECFQMARPAPTFSLFGCMDTDSVNELTDFHDTAGKVCTNSSSVNHSWICCEGHFCSNQTTMYLPPLPSRIWSTVWIMTTAIIVVVFAAVIFVILKVGPSPWKTKLLWFFRKRPSAAVVGNDEAESETSQTHPTSGSNPVTMSTTQGDNYLNGFPPDVVRMIMTLEEETSGSGFGSTVMHELTIGRQIKLMGKIGSGRFGNVSQGFYRGEFVAVKMFKSTDEQAFHKEVVVYETAMLRHPNVLRYIGSDRLDINSATQLWLVTEYHHYGSLHDYLQTNTIDLQTYYNLMRTAAGGLAFLHCAIGGHGNPNSNKPAIAHRDIKSRNIMVKSDLSCAIGDLGLSLSLSKGEKNPETNPKCGTVRYLAPEILDNTIQTASFESYMMADVYAFALVMWETLCRCSHENIRAREPDVVIPYGEYTDRDPTDQQMHSVVVARRLRPTETPEWRHNPEFQFILDLMEMGWSANPTARWTSLQLRMRLEKRQMEIRMREISAAAAADPQHPAPPKPSRDFEMIPMGPLVARGTKVYDQELVETRNGKVKDEVKDPLLG